MTIIRTQSTVGRRRILATRDMGMGSAQAQSIFGGAAAGASTGAAAGPYGAAAGAVVGAASSFFGGGAGTTHHQGPGSLTYWRTQLQRLQKIMKNTALPASLRQSAHDLAEQYKATDANDAIKGGYPIIPEANIAALESASMSAPQVSTGGFGGGTMAIAAVAVLGVAWVVFGPKMPKRAGSLVRRR